MGAEIKEMITANSPIKKFIEANLQLNGIYRINAEVKQVELISHHNCLLWSSEFYHHMFILARRYKFAINKVV